jgi:hypothetical protein
MPGPGTVPESGSPMPERRSLKVTVRVPCKSDLGVEVFTPGTRAKTEASNPQLSTLRTAGFARITAASGDTLQMPADSLDSG